MSTKRRKGDARGAQADWRCGNLKGSTTDRAPIEDSGRLSYRQIVFILDSSGRASYRTYAFVSFPTHLPLSLLHHG